MNNTQYPEKDLKLAPGEMKFMQIVWENRPLSGAALVKLCGERLDWKKSTTYTVLKRLSEKGLVENKNSTVTSLVSRREVQLYESNAVVSRTFGGDLPGFIAAFMDGKKLSKADADRIRAMIDDFEE